MSVLQESRSDRDPALVQANERLIQYESRFHTLFGLGNEGIVIVDAQGKPAYISPSIKKVMGYSDAEMQQFTLASLVHPDDLAAVKAVQARAFQHPGVPFSYPISRRRHKDGNWHWVEASITNLLDDPSVRGMVTHFRDVTERKNAQDEVLRNAHQFRMLIEQSADGIAILSNEGNPNYLSPSVEKILGFTKREMLDLGMARLVHPDDIPLIEQHLTQVLAHPGRTMPAITVRVMHKTEGWRWLECTLTNMLHDPVIGGIVDNFRDVTHRKEAEDRLRYSNRLYNFISQINQTVLHVRDEQQLFEAVCRIAIDYGKFEFAWIGIANPKTRHISLNASANATAADIAYFTDYTYYSGGPIEHVLNGEDYFVVSDISLRTNQKFNAYAASRGFKSAVFFAIKKQGETIGTFNLYACEKNFFNLQEIALLSEASANISFALDIFEKDFRRTQAESALQHKEQRLSQAQAIAQLGSWELNLDTGVLIWSDEALRIYGVPLRKRRQSYQSWLSYIHPEDRAFVEQAGAKAFETLTDMGFHHRIVRKDGSVRYLHTQAKFEYGPDGKPIGLNGVVHDITDQKLAEATALSAAEEKIQILESIRDAFFAVDHQWIVTYWNKEAEHFTKTPKEEIIGRNIWEVFPNAVGTIAHAKLHESLREGKPVQFEGYFAPGGRWYETSAYPSDSGISAYFKDITSKKQAEDERLKMIEDMIRRNKDLEQFSYIVSHNLRAPLANIKGLSRELSEGSYPPDVMALLKRELTASIDRLDEVIIDLSEILQMKKKTVENREYIDFSDVLDQVQMGIINLLEKEQASVIADFGQAGGVVSVKSYLHSIFYNLISNSIKYRRQDVPPVITIKSDRFPGYVLMTFSDNGIGIDLATKKDDVFKMYKRFHQHVDGRGLGLFMVKTQVEALGGKISIESAPGQGTTFRIEFPVGNA